MVFARRGDSKRGLDFPPGKRRSFSRGMGKDKALDAVPARFGVASRGGDYDDSWFVCECGGNVRVGTGGG